jgi:hypothetical protein
MARASRAIDQDEEFIYDVASQTGQIVANVKHMRWFRLAVAQYLIDSFKRYLELFPHFLRCQGFRITQHRVIVSTARTFVSVYPHT